WVADVDFEGRTLDCSATLVLRARAVGDGPLDLDTRDLDIASVDDGGHTALRWELGAADPILGARLRVHLTDGVSAVRIHYRTSPAASALQWLTPAETAGGAQPFLFSQCQAIHARAVGPLQ